MSGKKVLGIVAAAGVGGYFVTNGLQGMQQQANQAAINSAFVQQSAAQGNAATAAYTNTALAGLAQSNQVAGQMNSQFYQQIGMPNPQNGYAAPNLNAYASQPPNNGQGPPPK